MLMPQTNVAEMCPILWTKFTNSIYKIMKLQLIRPSICRDGKT